MLKLKPKRDTSSIPRLFSTLTSRLPALAILATLMTELSGLMIEFAKIKPTYLEISEDTHATRLIENNFTPYANMIEDTISIDQPYDLIKAKKYIKNVR